MSLVQGYSVFGMVVVTAEMIYGWVVVHGATHIEGVNLEKVRLFSFRNKNINNGKGLISHETCDSRSCR